MNRITVARNLVLVAALTGLGAIEGGCFVQGNDPDELGQNDDPRRAELIGTDGNSPAVTHSGPSLAIAGMVPLGAANMGPQPQPWHGANGDGDPNGPQPDPWKPRRVAPVPDPDEPAPAPKP